MLKRKLASIQKIKNLKPIEGKDRIELATILGWEVIVKKGDFNIGDLCVYIEYDSLLPERKDFEFLKSRCWSKKWQGYRIRCMKMAGVFSQGIVFPISTFPEIKKIQEGIDVTEILKIRKYDPETWREEKRIKDRAGQLAKKNKFLGFFLRFSWIRNIFFPSQKRIPFPTIYVSKTDEDRIQTMPEVLKDYKDIPCYISEKIDGTSTTFINYKNKFMVCSRNFVVTDKNNVYNKMAEKYDIKNKLKGINVAIQGETVGAGVSGARKNHYSLENTYFYVFNVIDIEKKRRYNLEELISFCKKYNLETVPFLEEEIYLKDYNLNSIIDYATRKSEINTDIDAEGIVVRSESTSLRNDGFKRDFLSFKVINPNFLLLKDN